MNKTRLLRLADKLQGRGPYEKVGPIKKERFDMTRWVRPTVDMSTEIIEVKDDRLSTIYKREVVAPDLPCGTAACAAGWAGSDPWFRRRGLYTSASDSIIYRHKNGHYNVMFAALEEFFGIDDVAAEKLFMHHEIKNRTPNQVANNIRKYVAKHTK